MGKCNRTRFRRAADVVGSRDESGNWGLSGVIKCGRWMCPACGPARARKASAKLAVCFRKHQAAARLDDPDKWPDVWMLTLTIPHTAADLTAETVAKLYRASELFFCRTRAWRQFEKRFGIKGRVRVLDATFGGGAGSHPHFHIALLPTRAGMPTFDSLGGDIKKEWVITDGKLELAQLAGKMPITPLRSASPRARKSFIHELRNGLLPAWEESVRKAGVAIANVGDFRKFGLRLSGSEQAAAYFLKWGLADEIGKPTAKDRNHLRLLDLYGAGYQGAGDLFLDYLRATDGRAWVTGLADACKRLGMDEDQADEEAEAYLAELKDRREAEAARSGTEIRKVQPLQIVFRAHLWPAALSLGHEALFAFCDAMADDGFRDVQREVDWMLSARRSELIRRDGFCDTC